MTTSKHPTFESARRRLIFSLILVFAAAESAGAQSVQFGTATNYPAGITPYALVSGDFNGDGKVDLAVTDVSPNSTNVNILLGNGNGSFQNAVGYIVGARPSAIVADDFNGDGTLDLATANSDADNVSVLIGNGDGTFQPAVAYPVPHPTSIGVADFNRDGKVDLAVSCLSVSARNTSILLGTGDGRFQSAIAYNSGNPVGPLALADFNRDGKVDVITANAGAGNVSVLLGNGDGTMQNAINSNAGNPPSSVAVGDFNRDGKLDVALGCFTPPSAIVLFGNGDGAFRSGSSYPAHNTPSSIRSGDFNGDGKIDLALTGIFAGPSVQVMVGKGDGTFQNDGDFLQSVGAIALAIGDYNGDTKPDLATTVNSQVSVVLLNVTPGDPDRSDYFVHQHYEDFLGREPDVGGFDYWTGQLDRCASDPACVHNRRIGVSAAFFVENEFQQSGYFVYRLYRAAFNRRPTYAEFSSDRPRVIGGQQLETSKTILANAFVQRAQFKQVYPDSLSNANFVNQLFDSAGLTPFAAERQAAIDSLNQGAGRGTVLRTLIEHPAFTQREYNPSFVLMQYFGYLRRDIDVDGYDFWLGVMSQQPTNYGRMVCAFITSAEYQLRFSPNVTHNNSECGP